MGPALTSVWPQVNSGPLTLWGYGSPHWACSSSIEHQAGCGMVVWVPRGLLSLSRAPFYVPSDVLKKTHCLHCKKVYSYRIFLGLSSRNSKKPHRINYITGCQTFVQNGCGQWILIILRDFIFRWTFVLSNKPHKVYYKICRHFLSIQTHPKSYLSFDEKIKDFPILYVIYM